MESITILSAAAAASTVAGKAYELVNWIRELCQGVKTVDERVRRLKSGVSELARACESVHAVLQPDSSSTTLTPPWDKDGRLAASISHQVSDGRRTLRELKKVLTVLRSGSSSRISRHMKMQDQGKHIDGLSARIKTHTDALQMSLQTVTIRIALVTPDFVIRELRAALQDTNRRLAKMEENDRQPRDRNSTKGDNEDPLLELAQDALRQGTKLYEASVAGSSIGADSVMDSEKAVHIGQWVHETIGAAQSTHAAPDDRSHLSPEPGNVHTRTTHSPVEDDIPEASNSPETENDARSSSWESWDDSQSELLFATEEKSVPTAEPADLCRPAMNAQASSLRIACPSTSKVPDTPQEGEQPRNNDFGLSIDLPKPLDRLQRCQQSNKLAIKARGPSI
jgi:hypothetical protein